MDIEKLNDIVYKDAKSLGACDKVMSRWSQVYDMQQLIDLFVHNQEFCIDKDFPSNEFVKMNTDETERNSFGVFVDDKITVRNYSGIIVSCGNSEGYVLADGFTACTIYVRHNTKLNVQCRGFSKVFIHAYNNCTIDVEQNEMSKVYIYNHSDSSTINTEGDVFIR